MINPLLIASNNPGKVEEIMDLLRRIPYTLVTPGEIGLQLDVNETGKTYEENACLKASAFHQASGMPCLADDTGLEVSALNGAPGLHSKRYTQSPGATDADRRNLLLSNLAGNPPPWKARFVCAAALALPGGEIYTHTGTCEGEIIPEERGALGFGYDRIFLFPEIGKTMAELEMSEKNRISHRAKAVLGILPYLTR